jgi:hypothetical protein
MQLNALSNYLQNQPMANAATSEGQAVEAAESAEENQTIDIGAYSPSQRAILISAVAAEFDVTQLSDGDVANMQATLQKYGLLQGGDLAGFNLLHNARGQLEDGETLDALTLLNQKKERFEQDQVGYSQRVQVNRMHTLIENLASARPYTTQQLA